MSSSQKDIDLSNRDSLLSLIETYKKKGKTDIVELLKDLESLSINNELLSETVEYYKDIIDTFNSIKTKQEEKLKNILQELKNINPASDLQRKQINEQLMRISQKLEKLKNT